MKDNRQKAKESRNKWGVMEVLLALGVASPVAVPVGVITLILYLGLEKNVFLILFILTVLLYLLAIILIVRYLSKRQPSSHLTPDPYVAPEPDHASSFLLGLMGGALLDRHLRKRKQSDDGFLWQEKIRRDMHEDGFTDW